MLGNLVNGLFQNFAIIYAYVMLMMSIDCAVVVVLILGRTIIKKTPQVIRPKPLQWIQ